MDHGAEEESDSSSAGLFYNNYINVNILDKEKPKEIPLRPLLIPISNPVTYPRRRVGVLYR